ncbi:MAG: hypothetical protein JNM10_19765 [Planctomycetia bacterium]|nr:hypothetical protein [Planctomycetia bacterium]
MNRRSITPTTIAALAVLAAAALLRPAHAADAPPAPAPAAANDVATIAAGLEAPDAATRAKAAETLGARYPEAAVAVPVLLDATRNEDATVRTAAVRALRLLGRRGQEDAAKAWTTMSAAGLAFHHDVFRIVAVLGAATTPVDLAAGFTEACAGGAELIRAGLFCLATLELRPPTLRFASAVARRDAANCLAVAAPWLRSSDATIARAAAAVVTILGRSGVSEFERERAPDDATASSPAIVPLLSSRREVVRFAAWRLLATGAPHSPATGAAALSALKALPTREGSAGRSLEFDAPLRVEYADGWAAARSLGAIARTAGPPRSVAAPKTDGERLAALLSVEAWDEARRAWALAVDDWKRLQLDETPEVEIVFVAGRDATLVADAAGSIRALLDRERRFGHRARALLALVDPNAPPDAVPDDPAAPTPSLWPTTRASACLALAWLAQRTPAALLDDGVRIRSAAALRRALVEPGQYEDRRMAAAAVADLNRRELVPPSTLVAALQARGTVADPSLTIAVLHAITANGDAPSEFVPLAAPFATAPTPPSYVPTAADRLRFAAGWPYVLAALEVKSAGESAEDPTLRRLAAIDALSAVVGDKAQAKKVLEPLTKDPDARVRYRAAKALRRLGG